VAADVGVTARMLKKSFDIDALEPKKIIEDKAWRHSTYNAGVFRLAPERTMHMRIASAFTVTHDKLLDWRALERRQAALTERLTSMTHDYWQALKEMYDKGKSQGAYAVWIPEQQGLYVGVFDGRSLGNQTMSALVKEGIKDPSKKAHVLQPDQVANLYRLRSRSFSMRRRRAAYWHAFVVAVSARIETFVKDNLRNDSESSYHSPGAFIIKNDDRSYVFTSDSYGSVKCEDVQVFA
jgi:hypothetical protein